jgi:hypothetical protein
MSSEFPTSEESASVSPSLSETTRIEPTSKSPLEIVQAQWKLLWLLGIAGLLASGSFNIYLLRQYRVLIAEVKQKTSELDQRDQQTKQGLLTLIQDVGNFSAQYPEVRTIMAKAGFQVVPANQTPPAQQPAPEQPALPAPPR